MIKFAIYAKVELTQKPDWLDGFMSKYIKPFDVHVTLKQPCYISTKQVETIKDRVNIFFEKLNKHGNIELEFDSYLLDYDPKSKKDDHCIMVLAKDNHSITDLQKGVVALSQDFSNYCEPMLEAYEKNFQPHVTIGDELSKEKYEEAIKELPKSVFMKGEISEVILLFANKDGSNENKTTYKLSQ